MTAAPPDPAAIWNAFGQRLRRFVGHRVANAADAEEIVQDVFTRLHENQAELAGIERIGSWLYRVTRNAIVDHARAASTRARIVTTGVEVDEVAAPDEEPRREVLGCMRPMLATLPPDAQEVLRRVEFDGASMRDVAETLDLTVPAAKSRVQRARTLLRDALVRCCHVARDARGRVVDLTPKPNPGGCCHPNGGDRD